jgi:2-oxoglutarate ferredoxin oxidoreductase subunit beta
VDILQPCVTFNKLNTFQWYKDRVYQLEPEYDPSDRQKAFARALEWGDRIPLGIIYKNDRISLENQLPQLKPGPLVNQAVDLVQRKTLAEQFN